MKRLQEKDNTNSRNRPICLQYVKTGFSYIKNHYSQNDTFYSFVF